MPSLSPRSYERVTLIALFALVFIIVTGGAVRLTGSGLGCSDWPTCESNQFVPEIEYHPMIEFGNRAITGVVSIAVMLAVLGSLLRQPRRRDLTFWSLGLVAGVIGQIVLGGLTVKFGLAPPFVMGHFLVSMVLVWNAVVLHDRAQSNNAKVVAVVGAQVKTMSRLALLMAAAVLATGTIVTGAGPHGGDEKVERLPLLVSEVVRFHGVAVIMFLAITLATMWMLNRDRAPSRATRRAQILTITIVAQAALGYAQYFSGVPVILVGLHIFGAVVVWVAAIRFYLGLFTRVEA